MACGGAFAMVPWLKDPMRRRLPFSQVPCRPQGWCTNVGKEHRIVSSEVAERLRYELGMEGARSWSFAASTSRFIRVST